MKDILLSAILVLVIIFLWKCTHEGFTYRFDGAAHCLEFDL